jgi:hypothetical protein
MKVIVRIMYTNGVEITQRFKDYESAVEYINSEGDHVFDWDWSYA